MKSTVRNLLLFAFFVIIIILFDIFSWSSRKQYTLNTLSPNLSNFRIGFGSCNQPDEPLDIWTPINQLGINVWVWGGDIIYADSQNTTVHKKKYSKLHSLPEYSQLRSTTKIIGTWDDHDYGANDGGLEYPSKRESQSALLDFLEEPIDSPRRLQEGVYTSYKFSLQDVTIKVVLLDVRYFREQPGRTADILGKAQWEWLTNVLTKEPTDITIVVSGTQVIPSKHEFEKWSDYPQSREKLLTLLHSTPSTFKIILSGDRHHAEISKESKLLENNQTSEIYELTSSGMTHSREYRKFEPNPARLGDLYSKRNFGLVEITPPTLFEGRPSVSLSVFGIDGKNVLNVVL